MSWAESCCWLTVFRKPRHISEPAAQQAWIDHFFDGAPVVEIPIMEEKHMVPPTVMFEAAATRGYRQDKHVPTRQGVPTCYRFIRDE